MTIEIVQNDTTFNIWTTNGTALIQNNWSGNYIINAYNQNFSKSTIVLSTSASGGMFYGNLFLLNKSLNTIFTVQDRLTADILSDVTISQARLISSVWTEISSKNSDITGKAQFYFVPETKYRFTVSKTGYNTKVFYLDPILYSTYTIQLDKSTTNYFYADYEDLYISYSPKSFDSTSQNNLTMIIRSEKGILTSYNATIGYPGGTLFQSGVANSGETFELKFNITGNTIWDKVNVTISYMTIVNTSRTFRYQHEITGNVGSPYTWAGNLKNNYANSFEKIILTVLIIIIITGFAMYQAGPQAGGVVTILCMVFAVMTNFLPLYTVVPGILIGLMLIATRSSQ
jgi:hypothetical protein